MTDGYNPVDVKMKITRRKFLWAHDSRARSIGKARIIRRSEGQFVIELTLNRVKGKTMPRLARRGLRR